MLRFLGLYAIAIVAAFAIASYVAKNPAAHPRPQQGRTIAQNYVATPAVNFAAAQQRIASDRLGHFIAPVQVEEHELPMLIDTGASFLSLTSQDAERLGIHPRAEDFTLRMQTANGISSAARAWLPHVRVGAVEVHDVEAIVMAPGASASSLLGMSFLSKLRRFGISNGELLLEQ